MYAFFDDKVLTEYLCIGAIEAHMSTGTNTMRPGRLLLVHSRIAYTPGVGTASNLLRWMEVWTTKVVCTPVTARQSSRTLWECVDGNIAPDAGYRRKRSKAVII